MPSTFGIASLIPGLVNEVALEIFLHFVAVDWDGPFTLVLVCTAWRDMVLRSNFLQSLRRNRRGGKPALKEDREKSGKGICILSFDGGGPGSLSQLRMLDELMLRLAFKPGVKADELRPADCFDLIGGVGFGGLVALLLGRMRMTTSQAMDELAAIGTTTFPEGDDMVTREVNMARLRSAIESMLERHGHPVDIKLHESSNNPCKVVLFAAPTVAMDHCHTFRTYLAPRKSLECTFVDAACATMAIPEYFSSVTIGPRWRKQDFAGIPHGFDNPTREVLKESQLVFARPSDLDQHATRSSSIHCDGVARGLQYQFQGVAEYLRLNVDNGMGNIELDDWPKLGSIEIFTNVYLEMSSITKYIDKACQWLRKRNGSVTLGQLTGTNADCVVKFHSESLENYLKMEFKQMHNVIQQLGIKWITLVDPIGNDIPIPISLCLNYKMLSEVISVYFRHQKVPGSDFVKRRDYRLVHGDRKKTVDPMEWTRVEKVGLKVEMSMILRRRNQNITRCPSCSTSFGGHAIDGWAQCLSCSTQFQTETQVRVEPEDEPKAWLEDTQSDEEPLVESGMTSAVRKSKNSRPQMSERPSSGEAVQPQFRLISVINIEGNYQQNTADSVPSHDILPPVNSLGPNAPAEPGSHAWLSNCVMSLSPQQRIEVEVAYEIWRSDIERQILVVNMYCDWFERQRRPKKDTLLKFYREKLASSEDTSRVRGGKGGQGARGGAVGYTCEWPGCTKPLGGRTDRVHEHALTHLNIKMFVCDAEICQASFLRKNELNRHLKSCKLRPLGANAAPTSAFFLSMPSSPIASTSRPANERPQRQHPLHGASEAPLPQPTSLPYTTSPVRNTRSHSRNRSSAFMRRPVATSFPSVPPPSRSSPLISMQQNRRNSGEPPFLHHTYNSFADEPQSSDYATDAPIPPSNAETAIFDADHVDDWSSLMGVSGSFPSNAFMTFAYGSSSSSPWPYPRGDPEELRRQRPIVPDHHGSLPAELYYNAGSWASPWPYPRDDPGELRRQGPIVPDHHGSLPVELYYNAGSWA